MGEFITIAAHGQMVTATCPQCHIAHAFPMALYERAMEYSPREAFTIWCPAGHKWHYRGESDADKARRRAEQAEQANARLREERDAAQRKAASAERTAARLKKRAAAGVCPCCTRSFANMARHMRTKHPEFLKP